MAAFLIIGDSIAAGIAAALSTLHPAACDVIAKEGAATAAIAALVPSKSYEFAILSAGSNDSHNTGLVTDLQSLRTLVRAKRVVWIYPCNARGGWSVYRVACQFGDRATGLNKVPSRDGLHPDSYTAAVRMIFLSGTIARCAFVRGATCRPPTAATGR